MAGTQVRAVATLWNPDAERFELELVPARSVPVVSGSSQIGSDDWLVETRRDRAGRVVVLHLYPPDRSRRLPDGAIDDGGPL